MNQPQHAYSVSRRTLARGAAWVVPVVGIAAMAPHVAASGEVVITIGSTPCKSPGESTICGKSYVFADVTATNYHPVTAQVRFTSVTSSPSLSLANCTTAEAVPAFIIVNEIFTLGASGGSQTFTLQQCGGSSANIQNITFTFVYEYSIDGGASWTQHSPVNVFVPSTPPTCLTTTCPK